MSNRKFQEKYVGVLLLLLVMMHLSTRALAEDYPEQDEILDILQMEPLPSGVIFTIKEYDEDALEWVLPRVEHYIKLLHAKKPDFSVAMMSHGDELVAAGNEGAKKYPAMHRLLQKLVEKDRLTFHVCNTAARMSGMSEEDFPDYVNVVPFGPAQVEDYLALGYELVDLELTW